MRRKFQLPSRVQVVGPRRGDPTSVRGRTVELGAQARNLRSGAESVSKRLGGGGGTRPVAGGRQITTRGNSLGPRAQAVRISPPAAPIASGGGVTILPPVNHVHHSGAITTSSWSGCYPWYGFSFGLSFGYPGWGSPWYPWSCSSWSVGYPYFGWGGSSGYSSSWGYPFYSACYSSPYFYRYRCSPAYYAYAPRYSYFGCYYAFTPLYGFVPYYQSSYREYLRYSASPGEVVLEDPKPERELSAAELHFCEGWTLLRAGSYENAAQVLYTTSVEVPSSAIVHWFLAVALAGTGDLDLSHQTLGETLRLDPRWLRHGWDPASHLGVDAETKLREALVSARADDPTAPSPLAIEASLALLAGDRARLGELRGHIAESLIFNPDAPGLAEILAEIRRRESPAGEVAGHPDAIAEGWLERPSCESVPSLGFSSE